MLDGKPKRPVKRRKLILTETPGLAFPQTHPCHPYPILYLIVEWDRVPPQVEPARKRLQPFSGLFVDQLTRVKRDPGMKKILPAGDFRQLLPDPPSQLLRRYAGHRSSGPAPELV